MRQELYKSREELKQKLFKEVREELISYTKDEGYKESMIKYAQTIAKNLTCEETVLFIKEEDMKFKEVLQQEFMKILNKPCKIEVSEDIEIGGIRAYNEKLGIVIDETLDSKLEEQDEWFKGNSKLNIKLYSV
eukprot:TRINITY_DN9191_c0_g4_i1.p1 TRINITY_DN9191_c0_g4~~TRINITY_DN9191_c0_g4_i1.p1  ORF type:complete len:152 (-),score=6.10 TRINITY_DN9191_c0_g4_i1:93-491(-)